MTDDSRRHTLPNGDDADGLGEVERIFSHYVERLHAGERVSPWEIEREHPELASEIVGQLETFQYGVLTPESSEPLGTLGDYTLRRQIGRGGMGVVYEAWENSMARRVALKILPAGIAADTRASARFLREAQAAGKLSHPNVVPVYFTGVKEQIPFYAMEYVDGETLERVLATIKDADPETETPFGAKDDVAYFRNMAKAFADVADGLQHAHSRGVTHRDIKPSNLILDQDSRLRILDFGLARLEGHETLTLSGDLIGTVLYMSPEQAIAKRTSLDHRTDLYSLGATMYEVLTGEPPFRGKDQYDTLSQIIGRDPRSPRQLKPVIPRDLETIALKCLRKDPADRYGTAEALAQDLRRFVRGDPIEARPETAGERIGRLLRRHRRSLAGAAVVLIMGITGLTAAVALVARAYSVASNQRDAVARERDARSRDLYVSDMRLAMSEWESGNFQPLTDILDRHRPEPTGVDLRGWEWYYLNSLRRLPLYTLALDAGGVNAVAWSPDGKAIASGGADGVVRLWAADGGALEKELQLGPAPVRGVAWRPDAQLVAGVGQDGTMRAWMVSTGHELFSEIADREFHDSWIGAVAWSGDGAWLASAVGDGVVRIRDGMSGQLLRELPIDVDDCVPCLAWSPDHQRLAACLRWGRSGNVVMWETSAWQETARCKVPGGNLYCLSWHPNGRTFATASAMGWVALWEATIAVPLPLERVYQHEGHTYWVAWSPDGSRLASAGQEGVIKLWSREPPEAFLTVLRGHKSLLRSVAWSPDGIRLASASLDGTVKIWNPDRERSGEDLPGQMAAAWSPDGRHLATYIVEEGAVRIRDEETGGVLASLRCADPVGLQGFSPNGVLLAAAEGRDTIWVRDWRAGKELARVDTHHGDLWTFAWSPDGRWLATGGRDGTLRLWRVTTTLPLEREFTAHTFQKGGLGALAWSPDGLELATTGDDLQLKIWDTRSWELVRALERDPAPPKYGHGTGPRTLAWSPDGRYLAASVVNALTGLVVFDLSTGLEVFRAVGHVSGVASVAWSPDGRRLATGGYDHKIKIWDALSFDELMTLRGHTTSVEDLAWSSDGHRLLSEAGYRVAEVKIWDAGEDPR